MTSQKWLAKLDLLIGNVDTAYNELFNHAGTLLPIETISKEDKDEITYVLIQKLLSIHNRVFTEVKVPNTNDNTNMDVLENEK